MIRSFLALLSLVFLIPTAFAKDLTTAEKLSDLDVLVARIKSGYGPLQYKKAVLNIDVDTLRQTYADRIAATTTNRDFYYELTRFIAEFRDGHFSTGLKATDHVASLPFTVDWIEGKVLVDDINRTLLPEAKFPFQKGDEVLTFNEMPVASTIDTIKPYISMANNESRQRLSTMVLTVRAGARVPVPTDKKVKLSIRRGTSSVVDNVELEWTYTGTPIDEFAVPPMLAPAKIIRGSYDDLSTFSVFETINNPMVERSFRCNAGTRTEIPKDATIIMKTPFVAYYYPTTAGNIGYLRIPHYVPSNFTSGEATFSHYEYAVSELEKNTVGLVIDQDHNCGGSVSFLHQLVSLFAKTPFKPMQFELLASKEEYINFSAELKTSAIHKTTLEYKNAEKVANLIKATWEKGEFLTPKTAIGGEDFIQPHHVRYSKPIIVLADEISGSGGDAFPSIMQGIGRATLIGSTTMGLGGHVIELPPLFYSQMQPRITRSLFYRPDGVAVENNGAVPDISYKHSREDFMYGYRLYRDFYTAKMIEMVQAQ